MSRARSARKPKLGEAVATARARFTRVSARKARTVADLIRGLTVAEAEAQLKLLHRPSAGPIIDKVLKSAVANVRDLDQFTGDPDALVVGEIFVDGGPIIKRFRPRAMGRAASIRKRTAHVTLKLYTEAA